MPASTNMATGMIPAARFSPFTFDMSFLASVNVCGCGPSPWWRLTEP
jgi:hypothetical protein